MSKYKKDIIRLRKNGKSYREIENELGCSRGTVAYHCQNEGLEDIGMKKKEISDEKKKAIRETYKNETAEKTAEIHDVGITTVNKYGGSKLIKKEDQIPSKKVKSKKEIVKTRQHKGILAEEKVRTRLTAVGYTVLEPNRKVSYDFAAEHKGNFSRIQVKHGRYKEEGLVVASLKRATTNLNKCKTYSYSENEIDYFAVYSSKIDEVYVISSSIKNRSQVSFRIKSTKNNQKKRVRRAKDYVLNENTKL